MIDAPSLGRFKARLNRALRNLLELKMFLLTAEELSKMTFKVPPQPKHIILRCKCK